MVQNNIKELLTKSLNKSWKTDLITKSVIWNTIIEEYKKIKDIDLTEYLKSISLKWNVVIIKTSKPIISAELENYQNIFLVVIEKKLEKIWVKILNLELKFK
jgi:hypothetical protein